MSRKSALLVAAVAAAVWLMPLQAHAVLSLAGDASGSNFCAADQNVGCGFGIVLSDSNPVVNTLALGSTGSALVIDGLSIMGSVSTAIFGVINILDSSSLSITNISSAPVTTHWTVSATGFVPPVATSFLSGSGTWVTAAGSTITLTWFNDPANRQGAGTSTDRPGTLLATFSDVANGFADSFSFSSIVPVSDPAPFSMTMGFDLTLVPGGSLISRGQTEIKPQGTAVPEPSTLVLVGLGLGLIGLRRRQPVR
ncbi:MAG TPA: PEP-CTERM sorting domain-containing protein [Methylomirabilota bacterium]|nr:PEP-CTERM sorting domain-containing protein [Methylomirabilota bacterium]